MRTGLIAGLLAIGMAAGTAAQTQPLLQLQGSPYFGGPVKLHLSGTVGQPALLAYGLNPLTTPIQTGKGPWFIGSMMNLLALGNIPTGGRIDMPFTMPPLMPALAGIPIVMQGYVPWQLSNPAVLPLDMPYFQGSGARIITSPQPQVQAWFGDSLGIGDLNDDGHEDLIVGAWFEDWQGVDKSGRVYVFWGPEFLAWTGLSSATPKTLGEFGNSVTVTDLDRDGRDDLLVGETTGNPPVPNKPGLLNVYWGSSAWSATPGLQIESAGTGIIYSQFGRVLATGDYNGDSWPDIAFCIDKATVAGSTNAGRIDVYWGPGFSVRTEITSPDNGTDNFFGTSLASGDINGDGIDDLIEGSDRDDVGGVTNLGSAHLFVGPGLSLLATLPAPIALGFNTSFGVAVQTLDTGSAAGESVVVSDLKNHCFVYAPGMITNPLVISKPVAGAQVPLSETVFGGMLAVGDVNSDGRADMLISDFFEGYLTNCGPPAGGGRLYIGLAPYFSTFHLLQDVIEQCGDEFGWRSAAADLNGDGRADVVVGAKTSDANGLQNSGHVVLFFGNSGG